MRRVLSITIFLAALLAACSNPPATQPPAAVPTLPPTVAAATPTPAPLDTTGAEAAVQGYLDALAAKDGALMINHSCSAYEADATLELDAFQAVATRLEDVACAVTGSDGDYALVNCSGAIVATYNGEDQSFELAGRTYQVIKEGGEWRVCGYHQ